MACGNLRQFFRSTWQVSMSNQIKGHRLIRVRAFEVRMWVFSLPENFKEANFFPVIKRSHWSLLKSCLLGFCPFPLERCWECTVVQLLGITTVLLKYVCFSYCPHGLSSIVMFRNPHSSWSSVMLLLKEVLAKKKKKKRKHVNMFPTLEHFLGNFSSQSVAKFCKRLHICLRKSGPSIRLRCPSRGRNLFI